MKKALVVEGNMGICRLLVEILTEENYSVDTATNGLEAFKKIREYVPSVVLLDSQLPDMNGIEVLKEISSSNPNLPVVLLAYIDELDAKILMESGLVKYCILKPFSLTDLTELLRSFDT